MNKLSEIVSRDKLNKTKDEFYSQMDKEIDDTIENCILDMEHYIEVNTPKGRTVSDFTGGYIQQLSRTRTLYLFYGKNTKGTRFTSQVDVKNFQEYLYLRNVLDIYMYFLQESKKRVRTSLNRRSK